LPRLPEVPSWFYLGAVTVGAAVGAVYMLSREKVVVEVAAHERAMRPAIGDGTSFKVDASWLAKPTRNKIVAYVPPGRGAKPTVAWVVARPGDSLEVREWKLYVNGAVCPKAKRAMSVEKMPELRCPRGCVYVLVDSPGRGTQDSSSFGFLPLWRVMGSISP